jgi:hypothetical protein
MQNERMDEWVLKGAQWVYICWWERERKVDRDRDRAWRGAVAKVTAMEWQIQDSGRNPHKNKSRRAQKKKQLGSIRDNAPIPVSFSSLSSTR